MSGIDKLYSKDFAVKLAAIRLRTYIPAQVHNEVDVFENEEQDMIVSIRTQCIYDAVILYFNALQQVFENIHFLKPNVGCGSEFWLPGRDIIQQMKLVILSMYNNVSNY